MDASTKHALESEGFATIGKLTVDAATIRQSTFEVIFNHKTQGKLVYSENHRQQSTTNETWTYDVTKTLCEHLKRRGILTARHQMTPVVAHSTDSAHTCTYSVGASPYCKYGRARGQFTESVQYRTV